MVLPFLRLLAATLRKASFPIATSNSKDSIIFCYPGGCGAVLLIFKWTATVTTQALRNSRLLSLSITGFRQVFHDEAKLCTKVEERFVESGSVQMVSL